MTVESPPKPLVRALCYCRISSDPRDKRAGVDRQREDVAALCDVLDWTPAGFYTDNDRAASDKREAWERVLADLAAGKGDAIAAWDQDRNWRYMWQLEDLRRFFDKLGRPIQLATTGQGVIDLSTPSGVMMAQVKTAVSEHEIAMLKTRCRRAAQQRADRGIPKWRKAFGYVDTVDGPQLDPVTAPLVADAYAMVRAGGSLVDVARLFNDAGAFNGRWRKPTDADGKPISNAPSEWVVSRWTPDVVSSFMRAPRNAGLREYAGKIHLKDGQPVMGTWPPLVSVSTWQAVQAKLNAPGRSGPKSVRRHLLTGILQCGKCGHHLSGSVQKTRLTQYFCEACHRINVAAEYVETAVYDIVAAKLADPTYADRLLRQAGIDDEQAEENRAKLKDLYTDRLNIGRERGEGLLTGEQAKLATETVNAKIAKLERKQRNADAVQMFEGLSLGTPLVADELRDTTVITPDRFRTIVNVLMTGVTVGPMVGSPRYARQLTVDRLDPVWR
jgi:DNA invertase Pin-like site-specific DNA recombinase